MPFPDDILALAQAMPADFDTRRDAAKVMLAAFVGGNNETQCLLALAAATTARNTYVAEKQVADGQNTANLTTVANLDAYIAAYVGFIADAQAILDALPNSTETPAQVQQQINTGRQVLVNNRHHLLPNTIDWKGTVDVTVAMKAFQNASAGGVPQGTAGAPRTIDFWPGPAESIGGRPNASYLMDGMLLIFGREYTTFNMHDATTRPKPPIYLGTIRCDGVTAITGSYTAAAAPGTAARRTITGSFPLGPNIQTDSFLGSPITDRQFPQPTDGAVGIPYAAKVITQTTTTLLMDMDVTQTKTNQALYVNDRSRNIYGDGTVTFTSALLGRQLATNFTGLPNELNVDVIVSPTQLQLTAPANIDGTGQAWAVSGGWTGTGAYPRVRNRVHWQFKNCINTRLTNGHILGALPATWNKSGTIPRRDNYLEQQAGVVVGGGIDYEFDNLKVRDVWGDFFQCTANVSAPSMLLDGCDIHHNTCDRAGRQMVAPVRCGNVTIRNNTFLNSGGSGIDLEPFAASSIINDVLIDSNIIGYTNLNFIASVGLGSSSVRNITIRNNTLLYKPLSAAVGGGTNWVFTGNTGAGSANVQSSGAFSTWANVNGFVFTNNYQDMAMPQGFGYMVGAVGDNMTGAIVVSGNDFPDAKPWPPGGPVGIYEAKINGTFIPLPGAAPAKVGLPAVGCMIGAAVSGQTGTPAPHNQGSLIARMDALETSIGRVLDMHRLFVDAASGYNVNTRDAELRDDQASGRISILSMKIPTGMTWATMATSALLQTAADRLRFYTETVGCKIVFLVEHEIDRPPVQKGTPAEYSNLVTQQFTKIRITAPLVTTCVQTSSYRLWQWSVNPNHANASSPTQIKAYFPANLALLDCYGTDVYNQPVDTTKRSMPFSELVQPHVDLADSVNKPLVLHEIGVSLICDVCATNGQPAPNQTRNQWTTGFYAYVKATPTIKHVCWFHSNNNTISPSFPQGTEGTDWLHDWWIDDTAALKAIHVTSIVNDTYFNQF